MFYSFIKKIATKNLAKSFSKKQSKYSRLFDRTENINERKITNFFISVTKKYFPEYSNLVQDKTNNGFKVVFGLYMDNKIAREEIPKNLEAYPELLKVFNNCEEIVSHLGRNPSNIDKTINSFGFGVFFRDVIKIKMIGNGLRNKTILYKKLFCRDWTKHIAWLFVFKRYN